MRIAFFVLLLANAAAFAYIYLAGEPGARDAAIPERQVAPERLKLLTPEQAEAAARSAQVACLTWGPIAIADAVRARDAIAQLAPAARVTERKVEEAAGSWWVFIPALPTRQAAAQRVQELRRQGIEDVSLMPDDSPYRTAVSLGVFTTEEAAAKRFEAMATRGLKNVEVARREAAGARLYFDVRDGSAVLARLAELKGPFPTAETRECPAQLTGGER